MLGGATSFNNLIRPQEHYWRNCDPKRLGGLQVDDQLVSGSVLNRQVGWFDTLKDLVDIGRGAPGQVIEIRRVTHETARLHLSRRSREDDVDFPNGPGRRRVRAAVRPFQPIEMRWQCSCPRHSRGPAGPSSVLLPGSRRTQGNRNSDTRSGGPSLAAPRAAR